MPTDSTNKDPRHPRFANLDIVEVEVAGSDATFVEIQHISDLSHSGVYILTDDPVPVGTEVTLRFVIAGAKLTEVEIKGKVARTSNTSGGIENQGMGIQFIDPPEQALKAIDSIVSEDLAK